MIWAVVIVFAAYFISMAALVYGFKKIAPFSSETEKSKTRFSLIIPFRNEAENLQALLESIEKSEYDSELLEIIFVNDASEDNSENDYFRSD